MVLYLILIKLNNLRFIYIKKGLILIDINDKALFI